MATTINTDNIAIGEGDLTLKGSNDVEAIAVGACANHSIDFSTKQLKVECGQSLFPILQFIIGIECKGDIDLLEASMRNLVIAFGGDPNDIQTVGNSYVYTIEGVLSEPPSFELEYKVPRVQDKTKYIAVKLFKVQSAGGLKFVFKKDKENSYKFSYTGLADTTQEGNPVGTITIDLLGSELGGLDKLDATKVAAELKASVDAAKKAADKAVSKPAA